MELNYWQEVLLIMHNNNNQIIELITEQLGPNHADIYRFIAEEDQIMSTYGLECATNLSPEILDECLGDLVRASFIRVYTKHNRPPAWETVKEVAKAC